MAVLIWSKIARILLFNKIDSITLYFFQQKGVHILVHPYHIHRTLKKVLQKSFQTNHQKHLGSHVHADIYIAFSKMLVSGHRPKQPQRLYAESRPQLFRMGVYQCYTFFLCLHDTRTFCCKDSPFSCPFQILEAFSSLVYIVSFSLEFYKTLSWQACIEKNQVC